MKWYFWILIAIVVLVIIYFATKNKKATGSFFPRKKGSAVIQAYTPQTSDCFKKCMEESNASSGDAAVTECVQKCNEKL